MKDNEVSSVQTEMTGQTKTGNPEPKPFLKRETAANEKKAEEKQNTDSAFSRTFRDEAATDYRDPAVNERRHIHPDPMIERHLLHEKARAQKQKILLALTAVFAVFAVICIIAALVQGAQIRMESFGGHGDFGSYGYGEFFAVPQVSQAAASNGLPLIILGSALLICMSLFAIALIRELPWISSAGMRFSTQHHAEPAGPQLQKEPERRKGTDPAKKEEEVLPAVPSAQGQDNPSAG